MKRFKAPWGWLLWLVSGVVTAIWLAVSLRGTGGRILPLVLIAGAALFVVRGYSIQGDCLLVERLFWVTRSGPGGSANGTL